jgi:hypothetical protein
MWGNCPGLKEWSAAELVAHLAVVERGVITTVDRRTQKSPIPVPFLRRFHLPLWLMEARVIRRRSPVPLEETLMADLRRRDSSAYCWRHPFLGMLNRYEGMEMIPAHRVRDTKQIREIDAKLSRKL